MLATANSQPFDAYLAFWKDLAPKCDRHHHAASESTPTSPDSRELDANAETIALCGSTLKRRC